MKIFVVGLDADLPAKGYGDAMHGSHARLLCIARGLAQNGHAVDLLTRQYQQTPFGELVHVSEPKLAAYNAVVMVGIVGWRRLGEIPWLKHGVTTHENAAVVLDALYPDDEVPETFSFARVVALPNSHAATKHQRLCPQQDVFYLPWCCPPDIPEMPNPWSNPWPNGPPRVVFAGLVHSRYEAMLNALAERPEYELWIAGLFGGGADGYFRGLTDEQRRQRLHPRVYLGSDLFGELPDMHQGPVRYLDAHRMMQHAQVGLNLTPDPDYPNGGVSCKLYDYFAAGIRVVSESNMANNGDLVALDAGVIVPWDDASAMHEAIMSQLGIAYWREQLREHALMRFSWRDAARLLASHLEHGR